MIYAQLPNREREIELLHEALKNDQQAANHLMDAVDARDDLSEVSSHLALAHQALKRNFKLNDAHIKIMVERDEGVGWWKDDHYEILTIKSTHGGEEEDGSSEWDVFC